MRALRSHQIISGFFLENPIEALPALTHCGEALCSARHQLPAHVHRSFEFVYISRGRSFWRVGPETIQQGMGDLLVTCPGESHETGAEPGVEFHLLWAGLDLDRLGRDGVRLAALLRQERPTLLTRCHEMEAALRGVFSQITAAGPLCERVVRHYLGTFIALVEQRIRLRTSPPHPAAISPYSAGTARALAFMAENLDRHAPIPEIAAHARGGGAARFSVRFRQEIGVAPASHHRRLRLEAASQALRRPDATVTHVALRYGFSSSQHFSTAFRREFGTTPREWRQGIRPSRRRSGRPSGSSRAGRVSN